MKARDFRGQLTNSAAVGIVYAPSVRRAMHSRDLTPKQASDLHQEVHRITMYLNKLANRMAELQVCARRQVVSAGPGRRTVASCTVERNVFRADAASPTDQQAIIGKVVDVSQSTGSRGAGQVVSISRPAVPSRSANGTAAAGGELKTYARTGRYAPNAIFTENDPDQRNAGIPAQAKHPRIICKRRERV